MTAVSLQGFPGVRSAPTLMCRGTGPNININVDNVVFSCTDVVVCCGHPLNGKTFVVLKDETRKLETSLNNPKEVLA
jgi:hypothetical protein